MNSDKMAELVSQIYREGMGEGGVKSVTVALSLEDGSSIYFRCNNAWMMRTDVVGPNGVPLIGVPMPVKGGS